MEGGLPVGLRDNGELSIALAQTRPIFLQYDITEESRGLHF